MASVGSARMAARSGAWPRVRSGVALRVLLPVLVVLAGAAVKAPEVFLPMGEDQGIFSYGGLVMINGGLLYRDYWETKPPLEYLVHGLVLAPLQDPWQRVWFGDSFTTRGQLALNLVDFVWSLATALAVYGVARAYLRRPFAWLAALLTIVHMNAVMLSQEGSIAEKHLLLPSVLAVLAYQRFLSGGRGRWLVVSGALVGVAALFKQPAAMTGLALAAHAVLVRSEPAGQHETLPKGQKADGAVDAALARSLHSARRELTDQDETPSPGRGSNSTAEAAQARGEVSASWRGRVRSLALLASGLAVALVPVAAWLVVNGLLADFWSETVLFNLGQAAEHPSDFSEGIVMRSWRVISESSGLLWLLALFGAGLTLVKKEGPWLWLLWAASGVIAILWGGAKLSQPYYLYVVPGFALLGAYAVEWLWFVPGRTTRARQMLVLAAGVALFIASSSFQRNVTLRILHERWPVPTQTSVVEEVGFGAPILPRGESLFVWGGETQLYLQSGSTPVTRHLHAFFTSKMHSVDPSYLERRAELMTDLRRNPPHTILIDPRTTREDPDGAYALNLRTFPELADFIAAKYEPLPDYKEWQGFRLRAAG